MTYTLSIKLDTKGYDEFLKRRFDLAYKLKREVTNWYNRQETKRQSDPVYKELALKQKELSELKQDETSNVQQIKILEKELKEGWSALNKKYHLTASKYPAAKEITQAFNMYKRYSKQGLLHNSNFYSIVNTVHDTYKKRRSQPNTNPIMRVQRYIDFSTITFDKSNPNVLDDALKYYYKKPVKNKKGTVKLKKFHILLPFKFRKGQEIDFQYAMQEQRLCFYNIKRVLNKHNKYVYYLQLVFDGKPYQYHRAAQQQGLVHISVDTESIKLIAKNQTTQQELQFDLTNSTISEKLKDLTRKLERSRRLANPNNYNYDGTVKKGKHKWVRTKNYIKLNNQYRYLWHKIKESRKNRFGQIANTIIELGSDFELNKDDFKASQMRKEYGTKNEPTHALDKRAQKGFDIMFNAPHEFVQILKRKLAYNDLTLTELTNDDED